MLKAILRILSNLRFAINNGQQVTVAQCDNPTFPQSVRDFISGFVDFYNKDDSADKCHSILAYTELVKTLMPLVIVEQLGKLQSEMNARTFSFKKHVEHLNQLIEWVKVSISAFLEGKLDDQTIANQLRRMIHEYGGSKKVIKHKTVGIFERRHIYAEALDYLQTALPLILTQFNALLVPPSMIEQHLHCNEFLGILEHVEATLKTPSATLDDFNDQSVIVRSLFSINFEPEPNTPADQQLTEIRGRERSSSIVTTVAKDFLYHHNKFFGIGQKEYLLSWEQLADHLALLASEPNAALVEKRKIIILQNIQVWREQANFVRAQANSGILNVKRVLLPIDVSLEGPELVGYINRLIDSQVRISDKNGRLHRGKTLISVYTSMQALREFYPDLSTVRSVVELWVSQDNLKGSTFIRIGLGTATANHHITEENIAAVLPTPSRMGMRL